MVVKAIPVKAAAACVVLASAGYPGAYPSGRVIGGLDVPLDNAIVFHAGTRRDGDRVVTAGGRVLGVTASGADLQTAIATAYEAVRHIEFEGMHYRHDIGSKGLSRNRH